MDSRKVMGQDSGHFHTGRRRHEQVRKASAWKKETRIIQMVTGHGGACL